MGQTIKLMQGNEACAEGALYAGCRFFAGYPITPSTEIAEYLSSRLPKVGGVCIQMEDEIASMGAILGASLAGLKTLTATSGPGFSLKQEHIGYACLAEIPCVIVDVMRGGPSTGFPTGPSQSDIMQIRWGTHGDHPVICLTPASVQEIFYETIRAFNLAEKYRTPVILAFDEIVGHMREKIVIPDPREAEVVDRIRPTVPPEKYKPFDAAGSPVPDVPPMAPFGTGYRYHVTGLNHRKDGFPTNDGRLMQEEEERLLRKISGHSKEIIKWEEYQLNDADVAIVTFGATARSARRTVRLARDKGIKAGLFRIMTMWPFPEDRITALADSVKGIVVPEMSLGQLIYEVERCAGRNTPIIGVGRVDAEPIRPETILDAVKKLTAGEAKPSEMKKKAFA